MKKALYLCDRRACLHCNKDCHLTRDISHAKNFELDALGQYVEKFLLPPPPPTTGSKAILPKYTPTFTKDEEIAILKLENKALKEKLRSENQLTYNHSNGDILGKVIGNTENGVIIELTIDGIAEIKKYNT